MKKHFYTHLIEIDTIYTELESLPIHKHEKKELVEIVHSTIHHVVIDTVMTDLSEEDKKTFLSHVHVEDHESVWKLLKKRSQESEKKIIKAVQTLQNELLQDIKDITKGQE